RHSEEYGRGHDPRKHGTKRKLLSKEHHEAAAGHEYKSAKLAIEMRSEQRKRQYHGGDGREASHRCQLFRSFSRLQSRIIEICGQQIAKPRRNADSRGLEAWHVESER